MPASEPAIVEPRRSGSISTRETWLKPNRRALFWGCVPLLILTSIGAWLVLESNPLSRWRWHGLILIVFNLGGICLLLRQLWRPRIAFQNGNVLFYLRSGSPIAVPVDVVEAFFAGQSPAHLPVLAKQPQTVNLIARLSQRHTEWARQTVKPALGQWCDGYVTIRGTWCEPLDADVIRRLNRQLKEVKDDTKRTLDNDRPQP